MIHEKGEIDSLTVVIAADPVRTALPRKAELVSSAERL
jgi:hypothetical protein